jgi:hypothetical protein
MKLFIMQSFPAFFHYLHLISKFSPQHPVLKHPQSAYFPYVTDHVSHPFKTMGKVVVFFAFWNIILNYFTFAGKADGWKWW